MPSGLACVGTSWCQIAKCHGQSTIQSIFLWMSSGDLFTHCDVCTKESPLNPANLRFWSSSDNREPYHTLPKKCKPWWMELKWRMNLPKLKFLVSILNILDIQRHWESIMNTFEYSPHKIRIFPYLRDFLRPNSKASISHKVTPSIHYTLADWSELNLEAIP